MKTTYKSKVYTNRPAYADFPAPMKFEAIKSIIATKLYQYPNAICSYSGGSDSDIILHLIETMRREFNLAPVQYCFFNTGLEMDAIKRHVRDMEQQYGVTITEHRPEKGIVRAVREHGQPFISKIVSSGLEGIQTKNIPLSIAAEYAEASDKTAIRAELKARYPKCESTINFLCGCNSAGEPRPDIQLVIGSSAYLLDFIQENPIPFKVSNKCCNYCKKKVANAVQKPFELVITGERRAEGGLRSVPRQDNTALCFTETAYGKYRLRPLYYVSDADKLWYKNYYGIRYSDAYEVYGLTRTGCCGCSISAKAVEDLERIRPYEPNLVKAAWNVFGARANPSQVILEEDGISFVSYGKSEKFLFDEIDQFRAKDFRGNGKIYVRVRAGKHHGRYWLHTFHYNDGEELFIYILKLEYKTHPTSLKAMAWDSTRPGEDKTPVLPWLLVHNKERG